MQSKNKKIFLISYIVFILLYLLIDQHNADEFHHMYYSYLISKGKRAFIDIWMWYSELTYLFNAVFIKIGLPINIVFAINKIFIFSLAYIAIQKIKKRFDSENNSLLFAFTKYRSTEKNSMGFYLGLFSFLFCISYTSIPSGLMYAILLWVLYFSLSTKRKRIAIAGVLFALAFLTQQKALFSLPFIFMLLCQKEVFTKKNILGLGSFGLSSFLTILIYLAVKTSFEYDKLMLLKESFFTAHTLVQTRSFLLTLNHLYLVLEIVPIFILFVFSFFSNKKLFALIFGNFVICIMLPFVMYEGVLPRFFFRTFMSAICFMAPFTFLNMKKTIAFKIIFSLSLALNICYQSFSLLYNSVNLRYKPQMAQKIKTLNKFYINNFRFIPLKREVFDKISLKNWLALYIDKYCDRELLDQQMPQVNKLCNYFPYDPKAIYLACQIYDKNGEILREGKVLEFTNFELAKKTQDKQLFTFKLLFSYFPFSKNFEKILPNKILKQRF